ncbi:MAG: nitroreductase family protein [Chloroflexi bacterium]|nr:nitroreductase family protein [Chloroflexota bacterium]
MEAIMNRRSIRKYTGEKVSEDMVRDLLKAAMAAPSAGNEQPWQFIVITDRRLLDEIPKYHQYSKMIAEVNVAILVCGDLSLEKHKGFWVQDCSASTQNILLAARDMGLGTVWLGIYPVEERMKGIGKLFGLPEHVVPLSLIPIGFPDEEKHPSDRFDESRIHYNKW